MKKIPTFKNREEEAEFWDTHSFTDYFDDKGWDQGVYKPALSEVLPIRFDKKTADTLRKTAARKGLGPTTLARMWIMERLQSTTKGTLPR